MRVSHLTAGFFIARAAPQAMLRNVAAPKYICSLADKYSKTFFRFPMSQNREIPEVGAKVRGRVVGLLDNGAIVDLGRGVRGMVDRSKITWGNRRPDVANVLKLGDELDLVVTKIKRSERSNTIFISLDALECKPNPWSTLEQILPVGSRAQAIVMAVLPFGLDVEIAGGFHGLIHISELSWTEEEPSIKKMFQKGDTLEVVIQHIDVEKRRKYASHRLASENPWPVIEASMPLGSRAKCKVVGFHSSGARIRLENGSIALVPKSELSWHSPKPNAQDVLRPGELLEVVIERIDKEKRQIYASRRLATDNPWSTFAKEFPIGSKLTGVVQAVSNYGVFVIIRKPFVGLLHSKEIPVGVPPILVGDRIGVTILNIDQERGRVSLGHCPVPNTGPPN